MSQVMITLGMMVGLAWSMTEYNPSIPSSNKDNSSIPDHKTGYIKGPAGNLYYDDGGQGGIPVVFVHSFGGNTDHWKHQLTELRKNRRAIAFDLRGHGRSDSPANLDYSIPSLADDIAAIVDSLGLKTFVLVGHSMGGAAAISYTGSYQKRVAGLIMSGTPGKASEQQAKSIMASLKSNSYDTVMRDYTNRLLTDATPSVDSMQRASMKKISKKTNLAIIEYIFQYDPLPALNSYPGPKLIVATTAEEDPNSLHAQMPDVTYKTIDKTSHWTQMDKPQEFNRIMQDFLATVDRNRP